MFLRVAALTVAFRWHVWRASRLQSRRREALERARAYQRRADEAARRAFLIDRRLGGLRCGGGRVA